MINEQDNINPQPFKTESQQWLGTWASAQQALDASRSEYPPEPGLENNTFRQIVRISVGGSQLRFKFSNEYGKTPLVLNSVHISKPSGIGTSKIDPSFDTKVTFHGGNEGVTIPAGEIITSDSVDFIAADLERIAVSIYFGSVPEVVTSHTGSRTISYLVTGNHVSDISLQGATEMEFWYFITGIDVLASSDAKAVVCLGDSTTDGRGVRTNHDNRWTDILAERLVANDNTRKISVLNQGIGGNAIFGGLGPAAYLRYDRDVLKQQGVGYVIVLEGINDIGSATSLSIIDQIIEQYKSFADQAHAQGLKIYGATIPPFGEFTSYYTEEHGELREQMRQKINEWIRDNEYYDAVIDFDAALKDKVNPTLLANEYSTDGLHPNVAGYKKMGEVIELTLFEE